MDSNKLHNTIIAIRYYYVLFYVLFTGLAAFIPVRLIIDGHAGVIYDLLAAGGVLLMLIDLLGRQKMFRSAGSTFLVVFMVCYLISLIANIRYGYADNVKTMVWTAIQFFVLAAIDIRDAGQMRKLFTVLAVLFSLLWTFAALWSIGEYIVRYSAEYWLMDSITITREGFADGRLFGIFTDPNYASLCSLCVIVFSVIVFYLYRSVPLRVFNVFVIVIQLIYVVLSGSRTSMLCLYLGAVILGLGIGLIRSEKRKKPVRAVAAVIAAVLILAVSAGICTVLKTGLSYLPEIYYEAQIGSGQESDKDVQDDSGNAEKPPARVSFEREDVDESDDISNNRFKIWKDYIEVFKASPIVGTSPRNALKFAEDRFSDLYIIKKQYSVHNSYLSVPVATGILGSIPVFLWMMALLVKMTGYLIRRRYSRDEYYPVAAALYILLAMLAAGAFPLMFIFFNNMVISVLFWLIVGLANICMEFSEPERVKGSLCGRIFKIFRIKRFAGNGAERTADTGVQE